MTDVRDRSDQREQPKQGSAKRPAAIKESPRRCSHCGQELPGVGTNPVSCPGCGQLLRFIA